VRVSRPVSGLLTSLHLTSPAAERLSLDSNALGDDAARALAAALGAGALPALRRLSLFGNRIGTDAALALVRAMDAALDAAQQLAASGVDGAALVLLGNPLEPEAVRTACPARIQLTV